MKARGVTQRRIDARAKTEAGAPPSDGIESKVVLNWWIIALFPVALGCLMYFVEASDFEKSRLVNPVATVGEFVQAECRVYRGRAQSALDAGHMRVTYGFKTQDGQSYDAAGAPVERSAQPVRSFTTINDIPYRSWAECEAALPVVQATKASRPVWYEAGNPHAARPSLDPPDSSGYFWVGLAAIPLALYAWLLGVLRQRQGQVGLNQTPGASATSAPGPLRYPLQFVKFTQKPVFKKTFVYLFFLLLTGGFVAQYFWAHDRERAGKERVRAAAAQAGK